MSNDAKITVTVPTPISPKAVPATMQEILQTLDTPEKRVLACDLIGLVMTAFIKLQSADDRGLSDNDWVETKRTVAELLLSLTHNPYYKACPSNG